MERIDDITSENRRAEIEEVHIFSGLNTHGFNVFENSVQ
jgi:hypothetical protein